MIFILTGKGKVEPQHLAKGCTNLNLELNNKCHMKVDPSE